MRILHISDTHGYHKALTANVNAIDADMIIHSGDCANWRDAYRNEGEVRDFLEWYRELNIKYKILIGGNHDTSIERGLVSKTVIQDMGIIYLENQSINIEGINIWGSPYTPSFGDGWAYNMARHKLHKVWDQIPENTDIVISHGPPKGILDLADGNKGIEHCGCAALLKRILKIKPKYCLFRHIHENGDHMNAGITKLANFPTIFSNGAVMKDGEFEKGPINCGNVFKI